MKWAGTLGIIIEGGGRHLPHLQLEGGQYQAMEDGSREGIPSNLMLMNSGHPMTESVQTRDSTNSRAIRRIRRDTVNGHPGKKDQFKRR